MDLLPFLTIGARDERQSQIMDPKPTILITGANAGLGLEMVKALYSSGRAYEIIIGGRSLARAEEAADVVKNDFPSTRSTLWPLQIDIEDDQSIQNIFNEVQTKFGRLDALINNAGTKNQSAIRTSYYYPSNTDAGAQFDQQFLAGKLTMRQMWNASWNVNTVGTQVMTATFAPLLLKSQDPRLLFMTSGTSTLKGSENLDLPINKVPDAGWPKKTQSNIPAYRSSKCGMNMMMRGAFIIPTLSLQENPPRDYANLIFIIALFSEWYRTLKEDGVKVWCLSPGFLATGLGGDQQANKSLGAGDPASAGLFVRDVLEGGRDEDVGRVILRDGVQPW